MRNKTEIWKSKIWNDANAKEKNIVANLRALRFTKWQNLTIFLITQNIQEPDNHSALKITLNLTLIPWKRKIKNRVRFLFQPLSSQRTLYEARITGSCISLETNRFCLKGYRIRFLKTLPGKVYLFCSKRPRRLFLLLKPDTPSNFL